MNLTEQARNIEAIERYFGDAKPRTPEAVAVRDEFMVFSSSLGEYERNFEQQAYDRARNLRLSYNRANATTEAERLAAERQALGGLSTEQLGGDADRRTASGAYVPPPSGSSQLARVAAVVGVGVVVVLFLRR